MRATVVKINTYQVRSAIEMNSARFDVAESDNTITFHVPNCKINMIILLTNLRYFSFSSSVILTSVRVDYFGEVDAMKQRKKNSRPNDYIY